MSEEQLKAFLEKVQGDTSLQEQLKVAADSDAILALANEAGYVFTAEDLDKTELTISDDELAMAAGGSGFSIRSTHILNKIGICDPNQQEVIHH